MSVLSKLFLTGLAALYVLSPIDLIPDPLLPFGVIDDVALIGQVVAMWKGSA